MADFLTQNAGTILVGAILLAVVTVIIITMVRRKKNGGKIIDCGGDCGACGGACASGGQMAKKLGLYKTVLKIDGMACNMCSAHINDKIRSSFSIKNVYTSHKNGESVILSESPLDAEELKKAIDETGYILKGIATEEI